MTWHAFDPVAPVLGQVRLLGFPEPLPHEHTVLYRFFNGDAALLYVGVTRRPAERWQSHKRRAAWWPEVAFLSVENHPHDRSALNAETAAIRAERPLFNKRSAPTPLTDCSCAAHAPLTHYSPVVLPRVGGGVGVGGGWGVGVSIQDQSSYLTVGAARSPKFGFGAIA